LVPGIISNHDRLRGDLEKSGHRFASETDTEVIAHLLEEAYRLRASVEEAFVATLRRLEGTFAIVMLSAREPHRLFCAWDKSPLVLGIASTQKHGSSTLTGQVGHGLLIRPL
jgi:glucosamine--fructose-6-phosphate aminotransferase (isomerizing)